MTSDSVPAGGDPRRLLDEVRGFAHRVRLAQRVTWLPLLALGVVILAAIPVRAFSTWVTTGCHPVDGGGEVCKTWSPALQSYWLGAVLLAYVLTAAGYRRVARDRGVGGRVLPYVVAGGALALLMFALIAAGAGKWLVPDEADLLHPSVFTQVLFRLLDPTGAMGLALLVLAWLERHLALALFSMVYLLIMLTPVRLGWSERGGPFPDAAMLITGGAVLLLGSAGFALAQRLRRPR